MHRIYTKRLATTKKATAFRYFVFCVLSLCLWAGTAHLCVLGGSAVDMPCFCLDIARFSRSIIAFPGIPDSKIFDGAQHANHRSRQNSAYRKRIRCRSTQTGPTPTSQPSIRLRPRTEMMIEVRRLLRRRPRRYRTGLHRIRTLRDERHCRRQRRGCPRHYRNVVSRYGPYVGNPLRRRLVQAAPSSCPWSTAHSAPRSTSTATTPTAWARATRAGSRYSPKAPRKPTTTPSRPSASPSTRTSSRRPWSRSTALSLAIPWKSSRPSPTTRSGNSSASTSPSTTSWTRKTR